MPTMRQVPCSVQVSTTDLAHLNEVCTLGGGNKSPSHINIQIPVSVIKALQVLEEAVTRRYDLA